MLRRATAHFPARHCAQALGFGPNYTSFRTSVVLLPPSGRSHATGSSGDKVIYDGFDLHFLGTSSGGPTRGRSANATLLTWNGHSFLFDCGEGTLRQFMHLSNPPMRLAGIFITHMHGDHVYGLPSMLLHLNVANSQKARAEREIAHKGVPTRRQVMRQAGFFQAEYGFSEESPLHVYGPEGLYNYIVSSLRLSHARLTLQIVVHELIMPRPDSPAGILGRRFARGHRIYQRAAGFKDLARPVAQFAFDEAIARNALYQTRPSVQEVPASPHTLRLSLEPKECTNSTATAGEGGCITSGAGGSIANAPAAEWPQVWDLPIPIELDVNLHSKKVPQDYDSPRSRGDGRKAGDKLQNAPGAVPGVPREGEDGRQTRSLRVKAVRLDHTVPTVGFVVEESPLPGKINVEKCLARGLLPGPAYKRLKSGEDVEAPDGSGFVRHRDVVGPERKGRKVVVMGDTRDSTFMVPHARNADVVVHEATVHHRKGGSRNRRRKRSSVVNVSGRGSPTDEPKVE